MLTMRKQLLHTNILHISNISSRASCTAGTGATHLGTSPDVKIHIMCQDTGFIMDTNVHLNQQTRRERTEVNGSGGLLTSCPSSASDRRRKIPHTLWTQRENFSLCGARFSGAANTHSDMHTHMCASTPRWIAKLHIRSC